jgi:hypothetical protein
VTLFGFVNRCTQDNNCVTTNTLAETSLATPAPKCNEVSVFIHLPNIGVSRVGDKNGTLLKAILFINGKVATEVIGDDFLSKRKRTNAK